MTIGGEEEGFFWDTRPWVNSEKSGNASAGEIGCEDNNHSQMKQPEVDLTGGSSGVDKRNVAPTTNGGSKRNGDALTENADDMKVNDHDLHIWTERERRKKMRNMFHQLHALLPHLSPKADKSTIVDEAINHIKNLQQILQNLNIRKVERQNGLSTNNNIASLIQPQGLNLTNRESFLANHASSTSHFGIVSPPSSTSFSFPICSSTIFRTWTSHNVVLNVCGLDAHFSICSPRNPGLLTTICFVLEKHKLDLVSAQISSDQVKILITIQTRANVRSQFVESFPYEDVYKQAAAEIMLWITSRSS